MTDVQYWLHRIMLNAMEQVILFLATHITISKQACPVLINFYFFQKNVGIKNFDRDPLVRSMNFSKPMRRKWSRVDFRDFRAFYQGNKNITSMLPNITFVLPNITLCNRLVAE